MQATLHSVSHAGVCSRVCSSSSIYPPPVRQASMAGSIQRSRHWHPAPSQQDFHSTTLPGPCRPRMSHIARADTEIDRLTQMVMEEEGKLAALFEPGKPMPSAKAIGGMRDNLSALKTKLASLMSGSGSGSILPGQTKEEAAAKTQQAFAEIERSIETKYNRTAKHIDDSAEIALLEAENERLRYEASALLTRQQQLEEFMAHILSTEINTSVTSDFVG